MAEERDLILKLHENDTNAFDRIYWTYHQPIYKNALKLTRDEQAALDILQEVFTSLWKKRHSVKPDQNLGNWLFVVSFNLSVDYQRKKIQEVSVLQFAARADNLHHSDDAELDQLKYSLIEKAIKELSPQQKKVFTLCKLNGKSYHETAGILNISKHTVKEYLSYSMSSVRAFIKKHSASWGTSGMLVVFTGVSF